MEGNKVRSRLVTPLIMKHQRRVAWAARLSYALMFLLSSLAASAAHPVPVGTFIQWYLCKDWSDAKWQTEFDNLKKAGMSYLVFAPVLDSKTREVFYPSSITGTKQLPPDRDLVENILRNAKKNKFRVFLGLNFHDDWWNANMDDMKWLRPQMEEGNAVAKELYARYKKRYPQTFFGWYWVWEADNYRFSSEKSIKSLAEAIEINVSYVKKLDPSMPVMLCPFMNGLIGKPETYAKTWEYVFAHTSLGKGDIFCPQDCCGAGGLSLANLALWFKELRKAVNTKPGLKFWSDAETFDQRYWSSAPLDRFVKQLELVQPYVESCLTFAYSHYYSPNAVNPAWQKAYLTYVKTGKLPVGKVGVPKDVRAKRIEDGNVHIEVLGSTGVNGDLGYEIMRDGKVIGIIQIPSIARAKESKETFVDKTNTASNAPSYQIRAFDAAGNQSDWVPIEMEGSNTP